MPELSEMNKTVVFSVFWCVIWGSAFYLYAKITGWSVLARYYSTDLKPNVFLCRYKIILMRYRLSYEWATHLHATSEGLYLAVAFLFRPGHPCLFIPWNEITITTENKFVLQYVILKSLQAPQIKIRIPQRVFAKLAVARSRDDDLS